MNPIQFYTAQPFPLMPAAGSPAAGKAPEKSFGEMLKSHLSEVNHMQNSADTAIQKLASGQSKDIHNTMVAIEKADVAFQLTMQVRNKMLDAYQEIMRMQV